jgi:hypothetical protein
MITTHLEENSILAVESDLAYLVFFFSHNYIDLADVILLIEIVKVTACITSASLTS